MSDGVPVAGDLGSRLAEHRAHGAADSMYGRCTVCGLTWAEQTRAVEAEIENRRIELAEHNRMHEIEVDDLLVRCMELSGLLRGMARRASNLRETANVLLDLGGPELEAAIRILNATDEAGAVDLRELASAVAAGVATPSDSKPRVRRPHDVPNASRPEHAVPDFKPAGEDLKSDAAVSPREDETPEPAPTDEGDIYVRAIRAALAGKPAPDLYVHDGNCCPDCFNGLATHVEPFEDCPCSMSGVGEPDVDRYPRPAGSVTTTPDPDAPTRAAIDAARRMLVAWTVGGDTETAAEQLMNALADLPAALAGTATTRRVKSDHLPPTLIGTHADPFFVAHQEHKHPVEGCGYCPPEDET